MKDLSGAFVKSVLLVGALFAVSGLTVAIANYSTFAGIMFLFVVTVMMATSIFYFSRKI